MSIITHWFKSILFPLYSNLSYKYSYEISVHKTLYQIYNMRITIFVFILMLFTYVLSFAGYNYISTLNPENFSDTIDGKAINLYILKNDKGMEMAVCNYGAKVVSLYTKDKYGKFEDIILGYDSLKNYLEPEKRLTGSVVGRVAGRINNGTFEISGTKYQLHHINERGFHVHGGLKGFDKVVWTVTDHNVNSITFQYISVDGEEGYPGNLIIIMKYELTNDDTFRITYRGKTDKSTPVNLTHHSFFNLSGAGNGSIENHFLKLNSKYYLPVLPSTINTGEILETKNTPMDFTQYKRIGEDINSEFSQIKIAKGYDHTWIINKDNTDITLAASIYDPESGRKMDVYTNQLCVHFYTAKITQPKTGKLHKEYGNRSGFCIETMNYPDAMNQPNFPTWFLSPGEIYYQICEYRFSTID